MNRNNADFYVGITSADWIGSIIIDGDPWHIPTDILIQVNQTMFEELAIDHITFKNGYLPDRGEKWPHPWADSRMSDYVYIFDERHEQVLMWEMGAKYLVSPLKIVQGYSIEESIMLYVEPRFPLMRERTRKKTEEMLKQNGHTSSAPV